MTSQLAIDYGAGLSDAWSSVATFVPKLAAFLVILILGWIVAKILSKVIAKILAKVGFDRLAERSGLQGVLAKSDYDASTLLAKVVYYAVLLITLQLAIGVFGPNPIGDLLSRFVAWLPKLFVAILIIVIVAAIAKAVKDIVGGALGSASYGPLLATIASLFIWGAGIIAALNQIGVATTVTTPVLVAVLATVGGVIVVGVGGGLVRPMQQRWDGWLGKLEAEIPARRAEREAAAKETARHAQAQRQDPTVGQQPLAHTAQQAAAQGSAQAPGQAQGYQPPLPPQAPLSAQHTQAVPQAGPGTGQQFAAQAGQPAQPPTAGLPAQAPGQHQPGQHQYGGRAPQHSAPSHPQGRQPGADAWNRQAGEQQAWQPGETQSWPHGEAQAGQHAGHPGADPQGWQQGWQPGPDPERWPGSDPQDPGRPGGQ
ncbi:mechanosensitive ion channel family protein [Tsukamurella ocularis]|uniref:mechanosensitive ion channel family protein n=1 Tax=Tsukamurella ocularis TaxID=1970234 RepID=UPI0039EF53A8